MDKKEAIKQTVNTVGWELIEEELEDEFINKKPIKTESKSNEEVAREAQAREMNANDAISFLNKIRRIAGIEEKNKIRYK